MKSIQFGIIFLLLICLSATAAADDAASDGAYYTFKGDYTRAGAFDAIGPKTPEVLWDTGRWGATCFDGTPAIAGDYVYAPGWGGMVTSAGGIYCFHKKTGELIWFNPDAKCRSGITVVGDRLYAGYMNALACLNRTDGTLIWKTDDISNQSFVGFVSTPVVHNGIVYATGSLHDSGNKVVIDKLYGFDAETGEEKLALDINSADGLPGAAAIYASVSMSSDGVLYVPGKGGVVAFDTRTNETVWEIDLHARGKQATFGGNEEYVGSPIYKDGRIYVIAAGTTSTANRTIYCLDAADGSVFWKKDTTCGPITPCVTDELLVTSDGSHRLTDGEPVCTFTLLDGDTIGKASPLVVGNTMYTGTYKNGVLHAFNITTGEVEWTFKVHRVPGASPTLYTIMEATPAFDDGILYIGAETGNFYAIGSKNGEYYTFKEDYTRAGAVSENGPSGPDILWDVAKPYNGAMATFFDAHPVVVGDYVYTSTWNGGMGGAGLELGTFCFDKRTGEQIWQNPDVTTRGGMTVVGDRIYIGCNNALACLNRTDGTLIWKTADISNQSFVGLTSTPVVYNGTVYLTGSLFNTKEKKGTDSLLGFDAETGEETLRVSLNAESGLPGGIGMGASVSMSPDHILYVPGRGGVLAYEIQTKTVLWEFNAGAAGSPSVGGNDVYVGTPVYDNARLYAMIGKAGEATLYCFDAKTGKVVWNIETTSSPVTPCVTVDCVVTQTAAHELLKGEPVCTFTYLDGDKISRESPIVAGNTMYLGTYKDGILHAFNINTGEPEWTYEVHRIPGAASGAYTPIECVPAIDNGILYFGAENGHFYAIGTLKDRAITYDAGDVSGAYVPAKKWAEKGTAYTVTAERAAAAGYIFAGWQLGGEDLESERFIVNGNVELTARWLPLKDGFEPTLDDIIAIRKYLAGKGEFDAKYDVTGDGRVSLADLVLTAQYIADNIKI